MPSSIEETKKIMLRALSFARPHWRLYAMVMALSIVSMGIGLVTPLISKMFFDDILVNRKFELFYLVLGAFVATFILTRLVSTALRYTDIELTQAITNEVKFSLFSHLQKLHWGFYKERKAGDITYRFTNDVHSIQGLISVAVNSVVMNIISLFSAFAIALTLNLQVAVLAMVVVPFYFIADRIFLKRQLEMRKGLIERSAEIMDFIGETVRSYLTITLYGKGKDKEDEYRERISGYNTLVKTEYVSDSKLGILRDLITYIPSFAVLAYGGYLVLGGEMTVGTLIALQLYVPLLYTPLLSLSGLMRTIKFEMLSANRIFEILDTEPAVRDSPGARSLAKVKGEIRAKGVCVGLDHHRILKDVDLVARPGRITAVAGPSGLGKTTLMYVLARLYDPDRGMVSLDGKDLRGIKLDSLRENVCVVTQEPFLFSGTIEENIRFSRPDATAEELERAAETADADVFVKGLSGGYTTNIGVEGSKLSQGQKERIALARAFLANQQVLIIDEGFNSVDAIAEKKIMQELKRLARQGKTIILTSHRLSVLREADEIALLKEGGISERGGYKELLKRKGYFCSLYENQLRKG